MNPEQEIMNAGHPMNGGRCAKCGYGGFVICEGRNARGEPTYPFVCNQCGYIEAQYAKRKVAMDYAAKHGPLQRVVTTTERMQLSGRSVATDSMTIPCEVCGSVGATQEHHWAPWHLFGEEAQRWPKSMLCQPCHTRWHQIVTPNMGRVQ